jgi:hypothetical protein
MQQVHPIPFWPQKLPVPAQVGSAKDPHQNIFLTIVYKATVPQFFNE